MKYKVLEMKPVSCELCNKTITNEEILDRNLVISDYDDRMESFHYYHLSCYLEGCHENIKTKTQ